MVAKDRFPDYKLKHTDIIKSNWNDLGGSTGYGTKFRLLDIGN